MRARLFVGGLALALAVAAAACFSPQQPACAFSCGPAAACPVDYTCGGDGLCHRDDGHGLCLLAPQDGGSDAAETGDANDAASPD
jgi:hypothetical protein